MTGAPHLVAGRIGRPHGLDGSFHVTRPRPALLALGATVVIGVDEYDIERRSGTDARPILRLSGVTSREALQSLRGQDMLVPRDAAPALPDGEYWADDLEGCEVVTREGRELGTVDALRALPSCEVLEVGELLVPLVSDAVVDIDLELRRIVVDAAFLGL